MRHLRKVVFASSLLAISSAGAMDDRGTKADQDACTPDVFNLCSSFIPNEPAILACLQSKKVSLSPLCHEVLFPAAATKKASRRS